MEKKDKYLRHTYSYLALRKAVGWIGMLLPFTLMLGVFLIFKGEIIQESISHYYHTDMRDVFVGALCAIALFMFFYSGYDKWDDRAATFALSGLQFPDTVGPAWSTSRYSEGLYRLASQVHTPITMGSMLRNVAFEWSLRHINFKFRHLLYRNL